MYLVSCNPLPLAYYFYEITKLEEITPLYLLISTSNFQFKLCKYKLHVNLLLRYRKVIESIYSYPFCSVVCFPKFLWVKGNEFEVKTSKKNTCWMQVVFLYSVKKQTVKTFTFHIYSNVTLKLRPCNYSEDM